MKKIALKLDDLTVDSFSTSPHVRGGVASRESVSGIHCSGDDTCGTTHSLDYATHCACSGGINCTAACIEYSQATDYQACCG